MKSLKIFCFLLLSSKTIVLHSQFNFFETKIILERNVKPTLKTQSFNKISVVKLNEAAMRDYLKSAPLEFYNNGVTLPLDIPLPNGAVETFGIVESPILSPEQAALHPEIKTYTGNGLKNKKYVVRLSLTSNGFNAIVLNVENDAVYFESYTDSDRSLYFSYFSKDVRVPKHVGHLDNRCGVLPKRRADGSIEISGLSTRNTLPPDNNTGATLRTYRIAIAGTGEFTEVHTGANDAAKITAAYNDIAAYVNRMAAVYRNEICVSFTLVSGESVVYANKDTDPYTHSNSSTMLTECQTDLDNKVGNANYDVGHVIGQSSGSGEGLASAGVGCTTGSKAQGVSKIGGAPFAQIYFDQTFFHEVGHQFGMNHSYNSSLPVCTTRNQPTSVEPGAGATIMSYGFTCGDDDYLPSSPANGPILVFHSINYSEMVTYMTGNVCGTTTTTNNSIPVITEPANAVIPKSTPFALTATATDGNGDALTYSWEGTNIGETAAPDATTLANTTKPPFFRTYEPATTGGTRMYPILSAILDGSNYAKGDKLPSAAVATTHRITVRDSRAGGGATAFKEVTVTIDGNSGPFLITSDLAATYNGGSTQTVTWSVNNTTQAPVSCANVKISLSTDGGNTFPTVLLNSTANDGTENVTLPNITTTTARLKVEAVGNIFFDISNSNFTINSVLPVQLTELTVKAIGRKAQLEWQTASETNNIGFEIEKSTNGESFQKIGFIKGAGTTQISQNYNFIDENLSTFSYYRLKQIDVDGQFAYSKVVTAEPNNQLSRIRVYPNPNNGSNIFVDFSENTEGVEIVNYLGQVVFTQKIKDTNKMSINIDSWSAGIYFLKSNNEVVRFIKN